LECCSFAYTRDFDADAGDQQVSRLWKSRILGPHSYHEAQLSARLSYHETLCWNDLRKPGYRSHYTIFTNSHWPLDTGSPTLIASFAGPAIFATATMLSLFTALRHLWTRAFSLCFYSVAFTHLLFTDGIWSSGVGRRGCSREGYG
jgi:hypothetical protein